MLRALQRQINGKSLVDESRLPLAGGKRKRRFTGG